MAHDHGGGMLVLIGGLLVVSFLYFVSVMKKDDTTATAQGEKSDKSNKANNSQTSSPDVINMECSQSNPKYVCSICGSRTMTIKIEEKVEESTTTTCEIIEDENSCLRFNGNSCRVPFPEAGVDIIDRKLKNTEESLEKEIDEYCSDDDDILTYSESWTENWLFRKAENNARDAAAGVVSFRPVSMFVPNTSAKYRAMIGDQNVDEMSDLSDCSNDSDVEFEGENGMTTTRRKATNGMAKYIYDQRSRVFIDGKSKHHIEELSLNNSQAGSSNGYTDLSSRAVDGSLDNRSTNPLMHGGRPRETDAEGKNLLSRETRFNLAGLNDDVVNEKPTNGAKSNRLYYRSELFIETRDVNQNSALSDDKLSDIDFNLFSPPKPGTIADREHRKWQTAVPMENNPYSQENLQKRLMEKKYTPKYSGASSLLGVGRINGLGDGETAVVDSTTQVIINDSVDFETMDLLAEKSSVSRDNNTPIMESEIIKSKSAVAADKSIVINFETMDLSRKSNINCNNTPIVVESKKDEIVKCNSPLPANATEGISRAKKSKSNDAVIDDDEDETKNKWDKSKCTNSYAIKVTKKNATINEADYSSSDSCSRDEKISLPSVKKLVEVFSQKQREITEPPVKPKDKNTSDSEQQFERPKLKRLERTLQHSPRPLHLHSLTARSLSKEFREGLR